jgi:hypothetical protein
MNDGLLKAFFISCFAILFLAGAVMLFSMQQETENKREVQRYLDSKGKAPIPKAWRSKIGDGI